ncbi:MAG: hypothetical protein DRP49_09280 [Spirochaetes bacterium]|nr:MAG: hypothetical protein DRP49_09280 [Spirochaetota bacterium]
MISRQFLAQLGVIQGMFLFISFISMGWHNKGHVALSALALIISIRLIPAAFLSLPEFYINPWYLSAFNALIYLFGPLLWIYVINLTGRPLSVKLYKHFIPFALFMLIGFVFRGRNQQVLFNILGSLIYPYIAAYQVGMLIELRRFNRKAMNFVSNPERVDFLWFRMLLIGSIVLLLGNITEYMASNESYRNEELRLSDLACSTGYSSNTISMVLNLHQHENFYQFVNRFRIEDVKKTLSDPDRASESILRIAMDSGFRSKSTFNTVFREITGKTPSQYRSGK